MFKKISTFCLVVFALSFFQVAYAGILPGLSVAVDTTEVEVGSSVAYTIVYDNSTGEDYSDVVVSMDLPVGGGVNFVSSSLPEFWSGATPYWRLGDLTDGSSSTISFVVSLSDGFEQESISTSVLLTGEGDEGSINVGASAATVNVVSDDVDEDEDEDEDEEDDEDIDDEEDMDELEDQEESEKKEVDFMADGVDTIDVAMVVGGADVAAFDKNVNEWDNRFLFIGLVAFGLILIIGLAAYFLGRKAK